MPMAMRKGMAKKKGEREDKRRREAKEAGVVLERAVKVRKQRVRDKEGDVGRPGVGRMKGGMLRLSERDVRSIEGRRGRGRGGRGGRR